MNEMGEQCEIEEIDRLRDLPESLLLQLLVNLPTKDLVKTSVLSSKWRNLWRSVPGLDLTNRDFPDYNAFLSFVGRFLISSMANKSCIKSFKLKFNWYEDDEPELIPFITLINFVVERKVEYLHVLDETWDWERDEQFEIPLSVYTCQSLVSLKLCDVILPKPQSVSLPCLKVIHIRHVKFENALAFDMFISGCSVLESLSISRSCCDNLDVLRVCSRSLLSFDLFRSNFEEGLEEKVVEINAPKLEFLSLHDHESARFILHYSDSLVKVVINVNFNEDKFDLNDSSKRKMVRNFLIGLSSAKVMKIAMDTLEAIYNYSRYERLPLFPNLSSLYVDFSDYRWEMLPIFLESCPNLKSLRVGFSLVPGKEQKNSILPGSYSYLPTLEFIEIIKPIVDEEVEMKLMSYFLKYSAVLKKLTIFSYPDRKIESSVILEKFLTIPKLSTACEVVVSEEQFWLAR